jgi:hypothetical protein
MTDDEAYDLGDDQFAIQRTKGYKAPEGWAKHSFTDRKGICYVPPEIEIGGDYLINPYLAGFLSARASDLNDREIDKL